MLPSAGCAALLCKDKQDLASVDLHPTWGSILRPIFMGNHQILTTRAVR